MSASGVIKFNNLLSEAGHAFRIMDFKRAEGLLVHAQIIIADERIAAEGEVKP